MKILIDRMPRKPSECLFREVTLQGYMCSFYKDDEDQRCTLYFCDRCDFLEERGQK